MCSASLFPNKLIRSFQPRCPHSAIVKVFRKWAVKSYKALCPPNSQGRSRSARFRWEVSGLAGNGRCKKGARATVLRIYVLPSFFCNSLAQLAVLSWHTLPRKMGQGACRVGVLRSKKIKLAVGRHVSNVPLPYLTPSAQVPMCSSPLVYGHRQLKKHGVWRVSASYHRS